MIIEQLATHSDTKPGICGVQAFTSPKRSAYTLLAPVLLGLSLQSGLMAQVATPALVLPVATTEEASVLRKVKVVRSTVAYTCPSTGLWVDVPGATATLVVPAYNKDLFVAGFFAESAFWGAAGYGNVRVLLNGAEMNPAAGTDYAFDSNNGGGEGSASWEGHAVERSRSLQASYLPVNVTVKVQCRAPANTSLRLDDWHFTVEQFH